MITNLNNKEIQALAGWSVWKRGSEFNLIFEKLRVSERILSGQLKKGRKTISTSVKLKGEEVIPSCTCLEFQKSYSFCEHTVALILQSKEVVAKPHVKPPPTKAVEASHIFLTVQAMLVKGGLALLEGNPLALRVLIQPSDEPLNAGLQSFLLAMGMPLEEGEFLIQLPTEQRPDLLKLNTAVQFLQESRGGIRGSNSGMRFRLELVERVRHQLVIRASIPEGLKCCMLAKECLIVDTEEWSYNIQTCSRAVEREIVQQLFSSQSVSLTIEDYLSEVDALSKWFDLQSVDNVLQEALQEKTPLFEVRIEGTVKLIKAVVFANYGERSFPLPSKDSGIQVLECDADACYTRSMSKESRALGLLLDAGFSHSHSSGFVLEGVDLIQEFVAYTLPIIQERGWKLEMKGSFRAFVNNTTVLQLTLKPDPISEGDDWVSFLYTFQNKEGKGMKSGDVTRLIQAGRQSFSLKGGKLALISRKQYALINEAIKDCENQQVAGKYSVPKEDYLYLSHLSIKGVGKVKSPTLPVEPITKGISKKLFHQLRPYQQEGVVWICHALQRQKAALLADDMGLGKTIQSLAVTKYFMSSEAQATLIVCPATLISNWAHEINQWVPEFEVRILSRQVLPTNAQNVINLCSYQRYLNQVEVHHSFEYTLCVLDESSMIKNPNAKVTKALVAQRSLYKLSLTGTPIENSAKDLWSIFNFLSPKHLGKQQQFIERFVKPLSLDGYTAELAGKRLKAKLTTHVLRRTKQNVLTELPPKTYRTEYCVPSDLQISETKRVKAEYQELKSRSLESQSVGQMQVLTTILRLRQIANDPALLSKVEEPTSPKTERLLQILSEARSLGKKVLVFSQFSEMLILLKKQLEEQGHHCNILTGVTKNRDAQIKEFKERSGAGVFLISLKAGGYGLNLTEASMVVHYDPWWNPAVEEQATDRAYRMGQSASVSVIKLALDESIDEKILELQKAKLGLQSLAIEDSSHNFSQLTKKDLESLVEF